MCGICGALRWAGGLDRSGVASMNRELGRRGPDGEGVWFDGERRVVIGHRRLAVLDRTATGAQPMVGRGGGVLSFNGEVYGFRELRADLEEEWGGFRSTGDTEVVLAALERWGSEGLERLDGMFALAFWDPTGPSLLLARDRLGIKPIFWIELGDTLLWASEVPALLAHPSVPRHLDRESLGQWLQLGYTAGEKTLIQGVHRLAPGHLLVASPEGTKVRCWYDLARSAPPLDGRMTEGEAADALDERVSRAVRRRLVADVPLGCFLSGGVDSTVVSAHAAPGGVSRALTVVFPDGEDESSWASGTASSLGMTHRTEECGAASMLDTMRLWARIAGDPFADPSLAPTLVLSRAARREWTVALSGDGGDELFSGYPRLRMMPWLERMMERSPRLLYALGRGPWPRRRWSTKLRAAAGCADSWRAYAELQGVWPADRAAELLGVNDLDVPWPRSLVERVEEEPSWRRWRLLDALTFLPERVLAKVDRASMYHSLEVRVPLLDHEVVELVFGLPPKLTRDKRLLRRVLRRRLPSGGVSRRKRGFEVPLTRWLTGDLRTEVEEAFRPESLEGLGLRPSAVSEAWHSHVSGRTELAEPLFAIWQLVRWSQALDVVA